MLIPTLTTVPRSLEHKQVAAGTPVRPRRPHADRRDACSARNRLIRHHVETDHRARNPQNDACTSLPAAVACELLLLSDLSAGAFPRRCILLQSGLLVPVVCAYSCFAHGHAQRLGRLG